MVDRANPGQDGSTATLEFGLSSSPVGFASKAVASDNDANPQVVVRELLQNALDAAEQRTNPEPAMVEFRLREVDINAIPGIEEFRRAFDASCATQGDSIAAAARAQVEGIRRALQANTVRILEVRDNGVGLDPRRMNALLAEGRTDKTGSEGSRSAGSYGLGHFTTFAVTNLQYVLYGGVDAAGNTAMSAHAVLASHLIDGQMRDAHGYFIRGRDNTDITNWFAFPQNEEVPPFIAEPLGEIHERSGSGSVILIPAFNDFRETAENFEKLAELILGASAQSFYPAVHHGRLKVSIIEGDNRQELHAGNLGQYLEEGTSGHEARRAYAGYQAIVSGEEEEIATTMGSVRMYIRPAEVHERIQLSIFRNGMFIAAGGTLPSQLRPHQFGACKPFVGVLCFEPPSADKSGPETLYEMLRTSEGEKHLNVDAKRLERKQRASFHDCMRQLQTQISDVAGLNELDQFTPDFLLLNPLMSGGGRNRSTNRQRQDKADAGGLSEVPVSISNAPVPDDPVNPDGETGYGEGDGGGGEGGTGVPRDPSEPRLSLNQPTRRMRPALRAMSSSKIKVTILPDENIPNARLMLVRHSGADPSCDAGLSHSYVEFAMNGEAESSYQVPIGALTAGMRKTFEIDLRDEVNAQEAVFVPRVVSVTEDQEHGKKDSVSEGTDDG